MKITPLTLALALCLGSCSTGNPYFHHRPDKLFSLRVGTGTVDGELTATAVIGNRIAQANVSDTGSTHRFDVSRKFRKGALEVGVFYGTNDMEYGPSRVEVQDFGVVGRYFFRSKEKFRPYIECRLGARQQSMFGAAPGQPEETSGISPIAGLGLGAEYSFNDSFALFIQVEGAYSEGAQGSADIMTTETGAMIGGVFRF